VTTLFLISLLLYFLPSLIAHNKRHSGAIILLNLFAGWTIIGWLVALIWACAAEPARTLVYAGSGVHYCTRCGMPQFVGGRFCAGCGRVL
jgi:hypothetical protein